MTQDRKPQLQNEVAQRRAKLDNLRRDLTVATSRYKRTTAPVDGFAVSKLAGEVRLAEIALDGAQESLQAELTPRPVRATASRAELLRERAQIVQAREWRHKQHQLQIDQERQRCGYRSEQHISAHLRNVFGPGDLQRRRADEQDQRLLDHISAQLAELDRREAPAPLGAA